MVVVLRALDSKVLYLLTALDSKVPHLLTVLDSKVPHPTRYPIPPPFVVSVS